MPEQDQTGSRSAGPAAGPTVRLAGYDRLVEVGRGGFAVVYQAWQPAFTRHVAVKVIATVLDEGTLKRFERECLAAGALSGHPNIVTVYELGNTEDGRPYIVMEFLEGGSAADHLARQGPMEWPDVVDMGIRLAGALEAAHRAGVLHRDIKPENILLSRFGEPKLGDFGIASVQGRTETRSGTVTASVAHAPPEVLGGARPSVASDVYSLASTMFMLLDGRPAFLHPDDETILPLLARVATAPVPDLRMKGVPEAVCLLVEQGMSKDPSERPASVVELGRMLQSIQADAGLPVTRLPLEGEPVPPPPKATVTAPVDANDGVQATQAGATRVVPTGPAPAPTGPSPKRRRITVGAAVAVAVGIAVAVAVALSSSGKDQAGTITETTTQTTAQPTTPTSTVPPIFQDDFSSKASGWSEADNAGVRLRYAGGRYRFEVLTPGVRQTSDTELEGAAYRQDLTELGNVVVETTAFHDQTGSWYGLTCRKPIGTNDGYVALVNPNGEWRLIRWDPEERILNQGTATPAGSQSRVRLECLGAAGGPVTLRLFVDDRLVGEATDPNGMGPGAVGLVVNSVAEPAEVQFDDFAVRPA
ncbi:MAG: serine/threonine-protein kinase [Acidimicrobiales bacterium]